MNKNKLFLVMISFSFWLSSSLCAQNYPNRAVKLIVTNPAGGSSDIMARTIAQKLSELWKQSVIVENKAGGGGTIGMVYAANQPADGYTILFGAQGPTTVTPLLSRVPYEMTRDFYPLSLVSTGPSVMLVQASLAERNLQDFIALAKAKPNTLNFGSGGVGNAHHLSAELLNLASGIQTTHVPYKGGIAAANDLAAGQIQFMFAEVAPVMPLIKAGKLRPIAVASPKRIALLPEVPTFIESGFPGFISIVSWGLYLPTGVATSVIAQLQIDVRRVMTDPDLVKRFAELGFEAQYSSPDEYRQFLAAETIKYARIIKENRIKAE